MSFFFPCLPALMRLLSFVLLFSHAATQQIQGCDQVSCPFNRYGTSYCPLGNITANAIGITNFSFSLAQEPWSWTTTLSTFDAKQANSSVEGYERGYYLGLPPDTDIDFLNGTTGCALFFDEVSPKLKFPGNDSETNTGTCQGAMGVSCVADLEAQTQAILANISFAVEPGLSLCTSLESVLRDHAPKSCSAAQRGSWGKIHAREISNPSLPAPLKLTTCNPTTGTNYTVRLIDTSDIISTPTGTTFNSFEGGVTPIFTILVPRNMTERQQNGIEMNLSCVKPMTQQTGPRMVGRAAAAAKLSWWSLGAAVLLAGLVCPTSLL